MAKRPLRYGIGGRVKPRRFAVASTILASSCILLSSTGVYSFSRAIFINAEPRVESTGGGSSGATLRVFIARGGIRVVCFSNTDSVASTHPAGPLALEEKSVTPWLSFSSDRDPTYPEMSKSIRTGLRFGPLGLAVGVVHLVWQQQNVTVRRLGFELVVPIILPLALFAACALGCRSKARRIARGMEGA
jgi:hypothetical protein